MMDEDILPMLSSKIFFCLAWWYISVILALGRMRQENGEFKDSLGYITRPCLKKQK
jgi:hypothetical protein